MKKLSIRLLAALLVIVTAAAHASLPTRAESAWSPDASWRYEETSVGGAIYTAALPSSSWETEVIFAYQEGDTRLLFTHENGGVQFAVGASLHSGKAKICAWRWKSSKWQQLSASASVKANAALPLRLAVLHYEGEDKLRVALYQADKELCAFQTEGITLRMLSLAGRIGLSTEAAAGISSLQIAETQKPLTPMETLLKTLDPEAPNYYRTIARQAVEDMLANFWLGDAETGRIRPTWGGFSDNLSDPRGVIWESAMLIYELFDMWEVTKDPYYLTLLQTQARFYRENIRESEIEKAAGLFNWASDDCAWNALLFLGFYSITGDEWFVDRVIGLLDSVNERWYDEKLNGLYYKDGVDFMSLYETGIAWCWLRLWEIRGEQRFYDLALRSYEGMQTRLGDSRDDGLYYIEANAYLPRGGKSDIHEAASSSFLTGNMCMGALSAKLYRLTGEEKYLERVYKINEGLLKYYDLGGVLLDDRDAWTNGAFAAFYASEVLTLPGTEEMQELLKGTARSIVTNDRTEDGYYGGSWQGPATYGSIWYGCGSVPEQSMTTGTAVLMVTAAAILEAGIEGYGR